MPKRSSRKSRKSTKSSPPPPSPSSLEEEEEDVNSNENKRWGPGSFYMGTTLKEATSTCTDLYKASVTNPKTKKKVHVGIFTSGMAGGIAVDENVRRMKRKAAFNFGPKLTSTPLFLHPSLGY